VSDFGQLIFFIIIILCFIALNTWSKRASTSKIRIKKLKNELIIYSDDGSSPLLKNKQYRVSAKPDFIFTYLNGLAIVEFKGRVKGIKQSDIVQGKVGALAARDKYPGINTLFVYNRSGQFKEIPLPKDNRILYNQVSHEIESARNSKQLIKPIFPVDRRKCNTCSLRNGCR